MPTRPPHSSHRDGARHCAGTVDCFNRALAIDRASVEALAGLAQARKAPKGDPTHALVHARLDPMAFVKAMRALTPDKAQALGSLTVE